jgi:glycosyltransferase involved in cell wall biosynthesis
MRILLVTEKFEPDNTQRDGGSRLVKTLQCAFGTSLQIMQFGAKGGLTATWHFAYPHHVINRFERRLANANFIAQQIKSVAQDFTHIIFIHISMQFGLTRIELSKDIQIITFPMFLTASYRLSGEQVPNTYFEMEYAALRRANLILTPSYLEKRQLTELYSISEQNIRVIPRGVDNHFILPTARAFKGKLKCCSIGSIKPQKNTLELISLFADIHAKYQNATLQIIGPIQNSAYYKKVCHKINRLKLNHAIELTGFIAPDQLFDSIKDTHLHLSTSICETFGRAIFETLASGMPNIARRKNNAAAEFLSHLPYVHFVDNNDEALVAIEKMLPHLEALSSLAAVIGILYDDKLLSRLLAAEICEQDIMAISDFDGTLYHKNDPCKTQACINTFRQYPTRVVCSARNLDDLRAQLTLYGLDVSWIIACSGAVIADGQGKIRWLAPLTTQHIGQLEALGPHLQRIICQNEVLQICSSTALSCDTLGLRTEIYQNKAYIGHWEASKLHAIHKLLNRLDFVGRVRVFGDGKYDLEMLTYFDGTLVSS